MLRLKVRLSVQEITELCVRVRVRAPHRAATVAASPSLHPTACLRVSFDSTNSPGKKTQPAATRPAMAPSGGHLCPGTHARTCVGADTHSPDGLKVVDEDVSRSSEGEEEWEEPPVRALMPPIRSYFSSEKEN